MASSAPTYSQDVDIKEDFIAELSPDLLHILLKDHTRSKGLPKGDQANIFWGTNDYEHLGEGYQYHDDIHTALITGARGDIIVPRCLKDRRLQSARTSDKAEVFTPSWICNIQNNLVDEAWFGRRDVFNSANGDNTWTVNEGVVTFPSGKTWRDYVRSRRLEISCGEGPYLTSRYDTTTGLPIAFGRRIGILDRKLRVVSENCHTSSEWLTWAKAALQSTYGFEWQGDNLLLAREALLMTFADAYMLKFGVAIPEQSLPGAAYIISWNLWQMDGTKGVIPDSCLDAPLSSAVQLTFDFFGDGPTPPSRSHCPACAKGQQTGHIGIRCLVKDWAAKKELTFDDIVRQR